MHLVYFYLLQMILALSSNALTIWALTPLKKVDDKVA